MYVTADPEEDVTLTRASVCPAQKKTCVSNNIANAGLSLLVKQQVYLDPLFTVVLRTNNDSVAVAFISLVVVACAVSCSLETTSALT